MTWTLLGYGQQDWPRVVELARGMTCAWADITGFHVGACPQTVPAYSHLWAWSAGHDRLLRARIDGDRAVVGVLTTAGPDPSALANEQVEVLDGALDDEGTQPLTLLTWKPGDTTIGEQPPEVLPGSVRGYRMAGPMPVVFIGVGETSA